MQQSSPIRVMIVEDSPVVRTLLTFIVNADPRLTVASVVATAEDALAALPSVRPDVISMDIRLPGIDGLEATRRIMAEQPTPIVVISASIDRSSLAPTMAALSAGALAVVEKPVGTGHGEYAAIAREICTQLVIMSEVALVRHRIRPRMAGDGAIAGTRAPEMILCAASTGGPQALARLFAGIEAPLSVPVLLVQHMGGAFMDGFAGWLDSVVPHPVVIGKDGVRPEPGTIHVAPGDCHMRLGRDRRIAIDQGPPVGGQRPSATVLIESAAETLGGAALAIVLTGMGEDGGAGVARLRDRGGTAIAEHETSAVVYGMPAAAVRAGALALPLELMPAHLRRIMVRG